MVSKKQAVILLVFIATSLVVPQTVLANQAYLGGYFDGTPVQTNKAMVSVDFMGTDASQIPSNDWLGAVISAAGANGTTITGWIYQNGISLYRNNTVWWAPQSWYLGSKEWPCDLISVGSNSTVAFYLKIEQTSTQTRYKIYIYPTDAAYDSDRPTVYTYTNTTTTSENLLVGKQLHYSNNTLYFQKHSLRIILKVQF